MWYEHQAGRGANEIASALVKILEKSIGRLSIDRKHNIMVRFLYPPKS